MRQKAPSQPQPKNPQATLLGLPAELRLPIDKYSFYSMLVHIHYNAAFKNARGIETPVQFTWTPCLASDPSCLLFCANPKWSGLCKDEKRCTSMSNKPLFMKGIFALLRSCKILYEEGRESMVRNTVISIHPRYLSEWIDRLSTPQIRSPKRINLSCVDQGLLPLLEGPLKRLPNLQAIAWQGQANQSRMRRVGGRDDESLMVARWTRSLSASILMAIDAYTWEPQYRHIPSNKEHQTRFKIVREGKTADNLIGSSSWDDADVEVEVHKSYPVEWKNSAPWRIWWLESNMSIYS